MGDGATGKRRGLSLFASCTLSHGQSFGLWRPRLSAPCSRPRSHKRMLPPIAVGSSSPRAAPAQRRAAASVPRGDVTATGTCGGEAATRVEWSLGLKDAVGDDGVRGLPTGLPWPPRVVGEACAVKDAGAGGEGVTPRHGGEGRVAGEGRGARRREGRGQGAAPRALASAPATTRRKGEPMMCCPPMVSCSAYLPEMATE